MKRPYISPEKAVGYVRVSTEEQAREGLGLETQAARLRDHCQQRGFDLRYIYADTGSAVGARNLNHRQGLQAAARLAVQKEAVLVVTEPTRLFRNAGAAEDFLRRFKKVRVFSIADGRVLNKKALLGRIAQGELAAENIRAGTRDALSQKKTEGQRLGSPGSKAEATRASARSRKLSSDEVTWQIADILAEDPAYRALAHKAVAELLNRRGVRTTWQREWTEESVKRQHREAKKLLLEREQLEAELDAEDFWGAAPVVIEVATASAEKTPDASSDVPDQEDDEDDTERGPFFGMF